MKSVEFLTDISCAECVKQTMEPFLGCFFCLFICLFFFVDKTIPVSLRYQFHDARRLDNKVLIITYLKDDVFTQKVV